MAEMVPDSLPAGRSIGERRLFDVLQKLPDDCIVYYEPENESAHAAFLVICPDMGLLVIKCAGWRAGHVTAVHESDVDLADGTSHRVTNPLVEAGNYLELLAAQCRSQPGFDVLLTQGAAKGGSFIFPSGYAAFLSNIEQRELLEHPLGNLTYAFPSSCTITRDVFMPWWESRENFAADQIKDALSKYVNGTISAVSLTPGQVKMLRAAIHPEIRLANRSEAVTGTALTAPALNIDIAVLDLRQERYARNMGSGHRLIYGIAGSGKTVLLIARARYLTTQDVNRRILFICFNVALASYLQKRLADYEHVTVHHFDEWGRRYNVTRWSKENDDEFGERLFAAIQRRGDDALEYDTILIDEAQDFAPIWFRCLLATMKDPLDGDLVIVSDANQGLYRQTGISWKSLGVRARGRTIHADLNRNYRNTREIVDLARQFASPPAEDDEDTMLCLPVDPQQACRTIRMNPVLFQEKFRSAECNRVLEIVRGLLKGKWLENDLPSPLVGSEIGILYPMIPGHGQNEFRCFLERLRELDRVVWLARRHGADGPAMVNEPGIKVQTIHSAKGLDYRAVIVMWADLLPRLFFENHDELEERKLMYVALTRASDFLAITYSRPSTFIEKIAQSGAVLRRG